MGQAKCSSLSPANHSAPKSSRVRRRWIDPKGTRLRLSLPRALPTVDANRSRSSSRERLVMSTTRTLPKTEWRPFFDRMSKALLGEWAEIEVASLELGDQIVAEWIPMFGITYDSQDDLLDVALDRSDHLIRHPKEIVVEEDPNGL